MNNPESPILNAEKLQSFLEGRVAGSVRVVSVPPQVIKAKQGQVVCEVDKDRPTNELGTEQVLIFATTVGSFIGTMTGEIIYESVKDLVKDKVAERIKGPADIKFPINDNLYVGVSRSNMSEEDFNKLKSWAETLALALSAALAINSSISNSSHD